MKIFWRLLRDERGAITVDWVALSAGVLIFGIAVVYAIFSDGVAPLSNQMSDSLADVAPTSAVVAVDTSIF